MIVLVQKKKNIQGMKSAERVKRIRTKRRGK